jgi:CheY-like chemotaxis protein
LGILGTFRRLFQSRGFNVAVAENGKQAIEKIKHTHFDVALIDLCLPDMEGTHLFPYIQKTNPNAIKIMLSGKSLQDIKGADVLLSKPVQATKLLSIIDSKLKDVETTF